jgi:REP element-mobilizing transposase RayT
VAHRGQKLLAIHCMPDHTYLLIGQKPSIALSDLIHDVKKTSSTLINEKRWVPGAFRGRKDSARFPIRIHRSRK